jgi:hypothetical protein
MYILKSKQRKQRLYDEVLVPRKAVACADCHEFFPIICMDFDHVRGKKKFDISSKYDQVSMKALLEEIEKCDVVCANCHRIRTAKRISKADSSNR